MNSWHGPGLDVQFTRLQVGWNSWTGGGGQEAVTCGELNTDEARWSAAVFGQLVEKRNFPKAYILDCTETIPIGQLKYTG